MNTFILEQLGESEDDSGSEDDSEDDKDESKDKKKSGVYVPPKLAAVHYGKSL